MTDFQKLLNERQYEAVSTTSQFVRIVAGAGSGKTRVLTYRIAYLIGQLGIYPEQILAFAFTNKAANVMKERAIQLVPEATSHLRLSTFHSFGARFLRSEIGILGFPSNFTIFDEEDQEKLVKNVAVELNYQKKDTIVKLALDYIGKNKCDGKYPEDIVLADDSYPEQKECLKFFHLYEQRKSQQKALDFDDLLLKTIEILKNYPNIRSKWIHRFRHILIDEFQDTNDVQYLLVKLLMNSETSLYVVGDPDQTIYTWRGANQDIILNFNKDYPQAETIILDRNYRSSQTILDTANRLIAHNKMRVPKDLYTKNNLGEKVNTERSFSRDSEAAWVVREILNLKKTKIDFAYNQVAILYRSSYITLPFEKELEKNKIPFQIFGGMKFFQRREVKDIIAYFRLLYNTYEDISFERIINVPRRAIGDTTLALLKEEAQAHNLSLYNYIKIIDQVDSHLKNRAITSLTSMVNVLEATRRKLDEKLEAYPSILNQMVIELNYYEYLGREEDGDDRLDNVKMLFDDIFNFAKKNPDAPFEQYLEYATLATSQDDIDDGNFVAMMTIHVAKGLEYDYIFVIGLNEGVFPSARSMSEDGHAGLEEERRLCYVAFTRARKKLFVSCNKSYSFVLDSQQIPSRFFKEAGLELPKERDYEIREQKYQYRSHDFADEVYDELDGAIPEPTDELPPQENFVDKWFVGDIAIHQKFGEGVVTKILDDTIVEINFYEHGKKSILARHYMLSKKGGVAKA
ncbi:MAG: UvrD-helicase domain-containing protein [Bacilli bacterium]|jgi:DNA helicase-2/ATP-dependent DNA helicase PcrA